MRSSILYPLLLCLIPVYAKLGFKKDINLEKAPDFPPKITSQGSVPAGHLRPIGYQRRPEGPVRELRSVPTPQEFYEVFIKEDKPVTFRKMVSNVPAMTTWQNDAHLKKNYGDLKIHVVVKKELFTHGPQAMTFKKFLKEYQYEDWYLSNTVPEEMMKELTLPPCLKCGLSKTLMESEVWMSSGGTSSLLHAHADHDLHCVLAGRKDFIVIHAEHKSKVKWVESEAHPGAGYSSLDMEMINAYKDKGLISANWHWSTLHAGDCIYIPAGYMHQVRSFGRSFSSTMTWAPTQEVTFEDCQGQNLEQPLPLHQAPFMWTYTHGDRELANIKLNSNSLLYHLNILMRTEDTFRYELFEDFYLEIFSEIDEHKEAEEVWAKLAPEGERSISRTQLAGISQETLGDVATYLNRAHTHRPNHDEL